MLYDEEVVYIYKKILWSGIVVVVIGTGVFFASIYLKEDESPKAENQENADSNVNNANDKSSKKKQASNKNVDPFKKTYHKEEMTDELFRDFIHKMSHQKVKAEDKWGFYEITDERIEWLLDALDSEDIMRTLKDGDVYLDILNKWDDDVFSEVDKDHNAMWRLQGGTIGKATGILSEDEEQIYIENTSESD